ncbi:MAG TPA: hypothetical protein VMV77_19295 [Bacteroidales bacterium]|nr:hypothetical protein [Bacteroidales bacterium]
MKAKKELTYFLILLVLFFSGCAVKKSILSPDFYSSESKLGLILITNDIGTTRSGNQGLLDMALTQGNKYTNPLHRVEPEINPENQFKDLSEYENLKISIDAAIKRSIELEKTKY